MIDVQNLEVPHPYSEMGHYETRYHLKEKHDEMMELMLIFDHFCREHGIRYSLADGTLLGALRHGDFIPWDDDADVMVTREEYNKLRASLDEKSSVRLFKAHFLDRVTAPGFDERKIYLDLFINEDMPKNKVIFAWKKFKTRFLRTSFQNTTVRNVRHDKFSSAHKSVRDLLNRFLGAIARIVIGKRDVFELNDAAVAIKKHKPSGIYTRYTSRMYETNRRFDKVSYEAGYCDISFRGQKLMAINNGDVFLREMYGDYMKLLPEEKRKPEHPVNMMDSPSNCLKWFN